MAVHVLIWLGISLLAVGTTAVFWDRICAWFATHANPWLKAHVPSLQPYLEDAFKQLDKLMSPMRRAVIAAWHKVRPHLLKAVIAFEQHADGTWVRRINLVSTLEARNEAGHQARRGDRDGLQRNSRGGAAADPGTRPRSELDFVKAREREIEAMKMEHKQ